MQLPFPPGFIPHHGSSPSSYTDGSGTLYYSAVGPYAGRYGVVVFRLPPKSGQSQIVPLERVFNARGILSVDTDGRLYLTGCEDGRPSEVHRIPVPGWVPAAPAPRDASGGTGGVDAQARDLAQQALAVATSAAQQVTNEARGLWHAIQELRARPQGLDAEQVADLAREQAQANLLAAISFAEQQPARSRLAALMWQKAKDAAFAVLREHGLVR
jgi:hypothetical protein